MTTSIAQIIRAKRLGVLIRDARLAYNKSIAECAEAVGVTPEQFEEFELGEQSPSLPVLELLAFHLKIPVEHFFGYSTLADSMKPEKKIDPSQVIRLRQRLVGACLQQARSEAGLSLEELAAKAGLEPAVLEAYELGEEAIPLPVLDALAQPLRKQLRDFQDQNGPVGTWANQQKIILEFQQMPPELQAFVCKPVNHPYIQLAVRLSEMDVAKLRAVAEGLLEITL